MEVSSKRKTEPIFNDKFATASAILLVCLNAHNYIQSLPKQCFLIDIIEYLVSHFEGFSTELISLTRLAASVFHTTCSQASTVSSIASSHSKA